MHSVTSTQDSRWQQAVLTAAAVFSNGEVALTASDYGEWTRISEELQSRLIQQKFMLWFCEDPRTETAFRAEMHRLKIPFSAAEGPMESVIAAMKKARREKLIEKGRFFNEKFPGYYMAAEKYHDQDNVNSALRYLRRLKKEIVHSSQQSAIISPILGTVSRKPYLRGAVTVDYGLVRFVLSEKTYKLVNVILVTE